MEKWIAVFGRLHPLAVHLPIGLLIALLALEAAAFARRSPLPRAAVSVLVFLAAAAAVLSAVTGYALSREEEFGTAAVALHLRLGLAVAACSLVLALLHTRTREGMRGSALVAYRTLLVLSVVLLVPTGHLGASIAHGEDYLTEPLHEGAQVEGKTDGAISFARDIAPIFAARCSACHGETKRKGGLSLKDSKSVLAGGRDGLVIVPGKPKESEMLRRLRLPPEEEDHMPPATRTQPTAEEIARIEAWIAAGAPVDGEAVIAQGGAASPGGAPTIGEGSRTLGIAPADGAAVEALRDKLVHVEVVAKGSNLLIVDFAAAAPEMGDAEVAALLEPVLEQVADLSLARSRITDEALKLVVRMPNLSRLDVRETAVTDAGVAVLAGHKHLAELVLARTHITDAAVENLLALPALKRAFLWRSGLSEDAIARLRRERPDLVVDAGDAPDAKPLEAEKEVVLTKATPAAGAPANPAAPLVPINTVCPVTGKALDPAYQIVFRGKVIGFCCPNCPGQFWADPAKYESKLP